MKGCSVLSAPSVLALPFLGSGLYSFALQPVRGSIGRPLTAHRRPFRISSPVAQYIQRHSLASPLPRPTRRRPPAGARPR